MVVCLEQVADLHMAQLMPLPLTVSKIQIGFTFLVPAHLGSPGQRAVKWVCVCVSILRESCFYLPVLVHWAVLVDVPLSFHCKPVLYHVYGYFSNYKNYIF